MKREIEVFDYANEIMKAVKSGALVTTKAEEKVNSMTISWGTLGVEWGKIIFTIYVRENRFTKSQLDKNPEFTINIPMGTFDKKILSVCGTKSGKTMDKIKELGLTLEDSNVISVPAIKELPLTIECKVLYQQLQDVSGLPQNMLQTYYPQEVESDFCGANKDYHIMYYGEIVSAYIVE